MNKVTNNSKSKDTTIHSGDIIHIDGAVYDGLFIVSCYPRKNKKTAGLVLTMLCNGTVYRLDPMEPKFYDTYFTVDLDTFNKYVDNRPWQLVNSVTIERGEHE